MTDKAIAVLRALAEVKVSGSSRDTVLLKQLKHKARFAVDELRRPEIDSGIPIFNGEIWEQVGTLLQARTQWLDGDHWILLSTPCKAATGGACMMAMTEPDGTMFYTAGELYGRLMRDGWRKLPVNVPRTIQDCERY